MNTKIWHVEFSDPSSEYIGHWARVDVAANNFREAVNKAIRSRKGEMYNSLPYVTEVTLQSKSDIN